MCLKLSLLHYVILFVLYRHILFNVIFSELEVESDGYSFPFTVFSLLFTERAQKKDKEGEDGTTTRDPLEFCSHIPAEIRKATQRVSRLQTVYCAGTNVFIRKLKQWAQF